MFSRRAAGLARLTAKWPFLGAYALPNLGLEPRFQVGCGLGETGSRLGLASCEGWAARTTSHNAHSEHKDPPFFVALLGGRRQTDQGSGAQNDRYATAWTFTHDTIAGAIVPNSPDVYGAAVRSGEGQTRPQERSHPVGSVSPR